MKKVTGPQRGFTLIELLVVVAIIALLIAILLPSLGRAKANAVRVKCAALLKQWGTVITMYAQENQDYFGLEWSYTDTAGTKHKMDWSGVAVSDPTLYDPEWSSFAAQGRLTTQELRTCPGDPVFGAVAAAGASKNSLLQGATASRPPVDYAMVRYFPVISSGSLMYKTTLCNHPSTTLLMCDSPSNVLGLNTLEYIETMGNLDGGASFPQPQTFISALALRHADVGNVMFLDGHVEQHKYADYVANIPSTSVSIGSGTYGSPAYMPPANEQYKVWTTLTSP